MSDRYHRLPIYQDHEPRRPFDLSRSGRPAAGSSSVFDEMRRHMGDDWGADPFASTRTYRVRPFGATMGLGLDDDLDSLCKDFFELKPRNPLLGKVSRDHDGSRESLEEEKVFTGDSQGQGRKFQVSFDVKDYQPQDISVKVESDTLVVEAKREEDRDGVKSTKQFSRNIHIPKDVDPDKLQSSLSNDGVLTIEAPVPPQYQSVAYVPPQPQLPPSQPPYQPPVPSSTHTPYQSQPSSQPSYQQPAAPAQTSSYTSATAPATPSSQPSSSDPYNLPPPPAYPGVPAQPQSPAAEPPPQPSYPAPAAPPQPSYPAPPAPPSKSSSHSQQPPKAAAVAEAAVDSPVFSEAEGGRRLDLIVELGKPYTPDDILVKLEGRQLVVEAEHVEKTGGKKSKSCMSREFDLEEDIDPRTVQANFDDNGRLIIAAMVLLHKPADGQNQS